MKSLQILKRLWVIIASFLITTSFNFAIAGTAVKDVTCSGRFTNPITDICWSCIFPIKIAGKHTIMNMGDQEDYDSMEGKGNMFCACGSAPNTKIGVQLSFWEPTHLIETVRHPFCMVSLGGANWGKNFNTAIGNNSSFAKWFGGSHGRNGVTPEDQGSDSFYQVHWYKNPVIYFLEVVMDNDCLETGTMDIGWLTELDPTWKFPELAFLQAPDSALFANPVAQAVCAADCVKANADFPFQKLFWCAGCLGSIYPYTGFFSSEVSPIQAAKLMAARIQSKMHRDFAAFSGTSERGLCGLRLQPVMDKRQYKISMTYPISARKESALPGMSTEQAGQVKSGKCCEPLGRTTLVRDAGKAFPYKGQDFAYQVFRKRDCCQGYSYGK